jgi:N-acetylmuramoyl-L-alanine amidase
MTNGESISNSPARKIAVRQSGFVILSSFACHAIARRRRVIRLPRQSRAKAGASSFLLICLSIFPAISGATENLGILGAHPKWAILENYQETITHDEFTRLIQHVYCTHGFAPDLIEINDKTALILTNRDAQKSFTLRFASDDTSCEPVPRLWRPAKSLPSAKQEKPLSTLRIVLDPGHLGGKWAKMEERWFQVGDSLPVTEGDLTLKVARILALRLRRLGARVSFAIATSQSRRSGRTILRNSPEEF